VVLATADSPDTWLIAVPKSDSTTAATMSMMTSQSKGKALDFCDDDYHYCDQNLGEAFFVV
jgi:hypothetical protein